MWIGIISVLSSRYINDVQYLSSDSTPTEERVQLVLSNSVKFFQTKMEDCSLDIQSLNIFNVKEIHNVNADEELYRH